jgi:hypothetical protein
MKRQVCVNVVVACLSLLLASALNIPNHVNPGVPDTIATDANCGRILTAADPRITQMALKFVF